MKNIDNWAQAEMQTADFGDQRLNNRAALLLDRMANKPTLSIPAACRGWGETQAAYRFYDNEKVTWDKVLLPHRDCTIQRIKEQSVVLCIQDTSEISFPGGASIEGLGPLNSENQRGLHIHPTLAVTPERVPLGVLDAWMWARDDEDFRAEKDKQRDIEDKESIRWLEGYQRINELAADVGETQLIYVADRESDIYEIFAEYFTQKQTGKPVADLVIRSSQPQRKTLDNDYLLPSVEKQPILGEICFDYPGRSNQPARRVTQSVRVKSIEFKAPHRKGKSLPNVCITAILVREDNPPSGCEPITWLLLTTCEIKTLEDAATIVQHYCCRWQIEIFFKVLKSGCQIEQLQLEHIDRLLPAITLYMIVAWRILFLTFMGRVCPDLPCDTVFETQEWYALYIVSYKKQPPEQVPTLNEMIPLLAELGGYVKRKNTYPGAKTIWIGLQRLRDFVMALEAGDVARQSATPKVASG